MDEQEERKSKFYAQTAGCTREKYLEKLAAAGMVVEGDALICPGCKKSLHEAYYQASKTKSYFVVLCCALCSVRYRSCATPELLSGRGKVDYSEQKPDKDLWFQVIFSADIQRCMVQYHKLCAACQIGDFERVPIQRAQSFSVNNPNTMSKSMCVALIRNLMQQMSRVIDVLQTSEEGDERPHKKVKFGDEHVDDSVFEKVAIPDEDLEDFK